MKAKFLFLLWICCSVMLISCAKDDPEPTPEGSRTVLVYLAADNTLRNLAQADLVEMKQGMATVNTAGMHLLVYVDTGGTSARLIELQNKKGEVVEKVIKEYGTRNSVGVAETKEVFDEVFSNSDYKANSYGLVYWSHGDGWVPNPLPSTKWIGQDNGDYMNISDLVSILSASPHLDFVVFDACFMQSIEVAYALRNYTDYYMGSPTEIPGPGARYDMLVPAMFGSGDVALKVAAAYYEPYETSYDSGRNNTNENWTGGASFGLLKSSELENLARVTSQVLTPNADNAILRSSVFDYDKRSRGSSYYVGYYDMVGMMKLLTDAAGYSAWKQAYDAAVLYWATTPKNFSGVIYDMFSMEGTNGVSHYIPPTSGTAAKAAYRSTAWYQDAGLSVLGW